MLQWRRTTTRGGLPSSRAHQPRIGCCRLGRRAAVPLADGSRKQKSPPGRIAPRVCHSISASTVLQLKEMADSAPHLNHPRSAARLAMLGVGIGMALLLFLPRDAGAALPRYKAEPVMGGPSSTIRVRIPVPVTHQYTISITGPCAGVTRAT